MGPAPAVARIRSAVRAALADLPAGRAVLVACSGGADSVALAAATAFEAPRSGRRAGLITVDHGLTPGSDTQAARVVDLGRELGLDPVLGVRVEVGTSGGPEAAARDARYRALEHAAREHAAHVLLGHTLDDQAETVLLGLGRGSGARSIAGMAGVDGSRVRPLLGVRRAETAAACAALGLEPWTDPQNADPSFQRVRLRTEALPLLEDVLQGGVAEALARTGELVRADLDALDAWAAAAGAAATGADGTLDARALADLPPAIRTRILRSWLRTQPHGTSPLSAERTTALDALVTRWRGQQAVELPGGRVVRRRGDRLVVDRGPSSP
jgi:tRNA(Ile)-lysidine synthase